MRGGASARAAVLSMHLIGALSSAARGASYDQRDRYYANDDPKHRAAGGWAGTGPKSSGCRTRSSRTPSGQCARAGAGRLRTAARTGERSGSARSSTAPAATPPSGAWSPGFVSARSAPWRRARSRALRGTAATGSSRSRCAAWSTRCGSTKIRCKPRAECFTLKSGAHEDYVESVWAVSRSVVQRRQAAHCAGRADADPGPPEQ